MVSLITTRLVSKMQQLDLRETHKPLGEIMAYQNDRVVRRYMKDYGASKEMAEKCFRELTRSLLVCAIKPGPKITSQSIDEMWHTFLLFTKSYKEFCEEYLGRFINHEPVEESKPHVYLETRSFTADFFGNIDEEFWPMESTVPCGRCDT